MKYEWLKRDLERGSDWPVPNQLENILMKKFEFFAYDIKCWVLLVKADYREVKNAGNPIRVVHGNGSSYIVANQAKAIELGILKPRVYKTNTLVKKPETNNVEVPVDVVLDPEGYVQGSWT